MQFVSRDKPVDMVGLHKVSIELISKSTLSTLHHLDLFSLASVDHYKAVTLGIYYLCDYLESICQFICLESSLTLLNFMLTV